MGSVGVGCWVVFGWAGLMSPFHRSSSDHFLLSHHSAPATRIESDAFEVVPLGRSSLTCGMRVCHAERDDVQLVRPSFEGRYRAHRAGLPKLSG